jgi:hypothetical protein
MIWRYLALMLALGGWLFAQGPRANAGPRQGAPGVCTGTALELTRTVVIEGRIEAVSMEAGMQYPSVVIAGKTIKVAPAWFLPENDFELSVGDMVKVVAAPGSCSDGTLAAVEITKGTPTILLRDSLGIPLWIKGLGEGNGKRNPAASAGGGFCLDLASVETVTGTVFSVNAGLGIQQPSLVLRTSDERTLSIRIAPERVLLEQDVELAAGMTLKIKVAKSTCVDGLVALELTMPDGVTIRLRDEDGRPVWPR